MEEPSSTSDVTAELESLRQRLAEAEQALEAIRNGEVDALMIGGPNGQQVFTLEGAQEPYRALIEQMSEGAMTLLPQGDILYANQAFARLLGAPLERLIGAQLQSLVPPEEQPALARLLESSQAGSDRGEVRFAGAAGTSIPLRLGLTRLQLNAKEAFCLVASDLTESKNNEEKLRRLASELEERVQERTAELAVSRLAALNVLEEAIEAREETEAVNRHLQKEIEQRQKAEDALRENEFLLSESQRLGHVGSWLWKGTGPITWSSELYRIYGLSPETFTPTTESFRSIIVPEDRQKVFDWISACASGKGPPSLEFRVHQPDGSIRFVLGSGEAYFDGENRLIHMAGTAHDITERTVAEQALQDLHQQLLDTSRRAGMADVAANVLHNVGNVLNSVVVSVHQIAAGLGRLKTPVLEHLAELLTQQEKNLAEFLARDPQGKRVPEYLKALAQHLAAPQKAVLAELSLLEKNVEHIRQVVSRQQQYACGAAARETTDVTEVIEDAIRITTAGLTRHGVTVIREYAPAPPFPLDQHNVLQILVNLLHNAKDALVEKRGDKQITVRLALNGNDTVRISVADNGVGVPPENLTQIFQHGFTTRSEGHGFGLHSGILAAQSMGGTLTAHSDGPGQGAIFTLELPMKGKP